MKTKIVDKVYDKVSKACNKSKQPLTYQEEVLMKATIKTLIGKQKKVFNKFLEKYSHIFDDNNKNDLEVLGKELFGEE